VRVLLIDDDARLAELLVGYLQPQGVALVHAGGGQAGLAQLQGGGFDAVLLDVMMPGMDGLAVLRKLRDAGHRVPVIMLTARGDEADRVVGLELGADDYVAKPFSPRELLARLRAVLRRARPGRKPLSAAPTLRAGDLRMDRISRRAWLRDTELVLTPKAMLLLDYLITHPDELMSRDRLLEVLWGFDFPVGTRAVDNRIAELRRALGDDPARPAWIATIPGQGYRFVARVDDLR